MTTLLQQVSEALAATVAAISPGLVRVAARRRLPASGIIWSADGLIVTAHHVIEQDEAIRVGLHSGQTVPATLLGRDATTDLAVLRVSRVELAPPVWAEPDLASLRVGHLVLAVGRPGQQAQATLGIVSALGESWRTPTGGRLDRYVQTDVVMFPGFSGGPLVNAAGQVLGLNTSALLQGLSLTVPVATLRHVVDLLRTHGKIRRGYLGVRTQPVHLPAVLQERVGQDTGLLVITVGPHSPAEQGQLLLGDTLISLYETPVRQPEDLLAYLSADCIGA